MRPGPTNFQRYLGFVELISSTKPLRCQLEFVLLLRTFPYFESAHRVGILKVLGSSASCPYTPFSLIYFRITPQFWPSSLSLSTHFYLLITISSSVFLSTSNHLRIASQMFSLMFATTAIDLISSAPLFSILFIPLTYIIIHISVLSSKTGSAFLT